MTVILTANFPTSVWDGLTDQKVKCQDRVTPDANGYDRLITEIVAIQKHLDTGDVTFNDVTFNDIEINGALNHDGTTVGFYSTTPITQQTGVAVTAAGIHAALVALGLITA